MAERRRIVSTWVPSIDISAPDAAAEINAACERVGFLSIVGHGVPQAVVDGAWTTARSFFDLSLDDKTCVAMPRPGYPYGYSPIAGETLARSLGRGGAPDLKESFAIGPVDRPTHTITDPDEEFAWSQNLWPVAVPELRPAWEEYFHSLSDLAARLLRLMALALDMPEYHFDPMISRHTSAMRALNYPPQGSVAPGQLGASAHTDYGMDGKANHSAVQKGKPTRQARCRIKHPCPGVVGDFCRQRYAIKRQIVLPKPMPSGIIAGCGVFDFRDHHASFAKIRAQDRMPL